MAGQWRASGGPVWRGSPPRVEHVSVQRKPTPATTPHPTPPRTSPHLPCFLTATTEQ